ncbi:MAG: MarR family winged helix-turn-helix transcriptional regulator [Pseudomonadota bacterium]|nr:MarR family winged helix-turn-helix transcriptional regulator [Pseudomonadota bacterium]
MNYFEANSAPLEQRVADGLARLAAVSRQLEWQAAEVEGLSPTQADILRFVTSRRDGVRLSAAAAHCGVRNATASDAVSALERKGLVEKHADAQDGRAIALKATRKGEALVKRWPASYASIVGGLDGPKQEILLRLVTRMIRSLQIRKMIALQRTCVTCRFFRENVAPGSPQPHRCAFVGAFMADRHLRVDCQEHEPLAA